MLCVLLAVTFGGPPWINDLEIPRSLQQNALDATVRLKNHETKGEATAVRIKQFGKLSYFLTAAHTVENAKGVELRWYPSETYPESKGDAIGASVHSRTIAADLALLIAHEPEKRPCIAVCPPEKTPDVPRDGLKCLSVGCTGGNVPTFVLERLRAMKLVHKTRDLPAAWHWPAEAKPPEGRSGGPVIDLEGRLIGIISGTDDKAGFYVHASEIQRFIKDSGIAALKDWGGPNDRKTP